MFKWVRALVEASIAALGLAGCGAGTPLPLVQPVAAAAAREKQAFIEALKPREAGRPVVAVLALNEGIEMTDLLLPHAVLQRAGVAEVQVVRPRAGRVSLYPALEVEGAQDLAGFDRMHPLDRTLCEIAERYGAARRGGSCWRWSTRGRALAARAEHQPRPPVEALRKR